jgi:hypothetical protein
MCVPTKRKRKKLKIEVTAESSHSAKTIVLPCEESPRKPEKLPPPTLLALVAKKAIDLGDDVYAEVKATGRFVELVATTEPDTPDVWQQLVWVGAGLQDGSAANKKLFPRDAVTVAPVDVSVSLPTDDEPESLKVAICDLVSVKSDLPKALSATKWKAYEKANATTILTVVTNPDIKEVWEHLTWSEGQPGPQANQRIVDIPTEHDHHVTVKLGGDTPKEVFADLHICKWPKLTVRRIDFAAFTINRDARDDFPVHWTSTEQPPLCFDRNTTIDLDVEYDVEPGTDDEDVRVEGKVKLGTAELRWETTVSVGNTVTAAATGPMTSDKTLPDQVDCYDPANFVWRYRNADDSAWEDAGTTSQVIYSILGPPTKTVYWTFVDLSCRKARGAATVDAFVDRVFTGFTGTTGDGKGIIRLRDNTRLSYYKQGSKTKSGQKDPRVWSTEGILSKSDGTGRCGGWADVLLHTHAIHGVAVAKEVNIYPATPKVNGRSVIFLVRKCDFTGPGVRTNPGPFPYVAPTTCTKVDGLAGQGKTNPQFLFGDHVLTRYNGVFYDPSYGVTMPEDTRAYEKAAIAGLGQYHLATDVYDFTQGTTPQTMSKYCSPGWMEVTFDGTFTLNELAARFGIGSGQEIYDDPHNAGLKALRNANPLQNGDKIYVPRTLATKGFDLLKWEYK